MAGRRFHKVEGLANDFILIDGRWETIDESEQVDWWQRRADRLCHRRRGIGADGILLVLAPHTPAATARMVVINADGSRPEMCGNGIRCVARFLADDQSNVAIVVDTDAGPKRCETRESNDSGALVRVAMGPASVSDVSSPSRRAHEGLSFVSVDIGNPHSVAFVAEENQLSDLAQRLGPQVAIDPGYPRGTNVEFAHVRDDGTIAVQVWERGVGITQACGTGACAVAAAAVALNHANGVHPITIVLPGGALHIEVPAILGADLHMTGPAAVVFTGTIELD